MTALTRDLRPSAFTVRFVIFYLYAIFLISYKLSFVRSVFPFKTGTTQDITKAPASSPRSSDTIDSILISDAATQEIITTSLSVYSSNQHPVNTSPVSLHLPQTCDISMYMILKCATTASL